jgi:hypothetical protein
MIQAGPKRWRDADLLVKHWAISLTMAAGVRIFWMDWKG